MSDAKGDAPPRLSRFHVAGLFGEFDHIIDLRLAERITAVIAPNGSGKTVCLRLINSLFRRHWPTFAATQFEFVQFGFSNGASVTVVKSVGPDPDDDALSVGITIRAESAEGNVEEWSPRLRDDHRLRSGQVERYLSFLTRVGPTRWVHDHTGQSYTFHEVIQTFGDSLPFSSRGLYAGEPKALADLIDAIDCHLIETQRLLIIPEDSRLDRRTSSTLAIANKAQTLKAIIASELTNYAALSQSLDRSFPRRVIGQQSIATTGDLRRSIEAVDEQRKQLMAAGILDNEGHDQMSLPAGDIDLAVARVLTIYATDTKQKLDSLSILQARIGAFKTLIEQRFKPKTVEVNKADGFRIFNRGGQSVPLEKLSSGEQHQLVLFFELLFELKSNALILIDEPELSLHVAWQKKFLGDLQRIINLNGFDVVLATHSPQLIGRWAHLVVELGDVDDDEVD